MRVLLSLFVALMFTAASAEAATWTVSGNQFYRNGAPWVPRGFEMLGIAAPKGRLNSNCLSPGIRAAMSSWSTAKILTATKVQGVNTIELNVSMDGLDPASPIYDPGYADVVIGAVRAIRSTGAVAMIAMNEHRGDGYCPPWRVAYHPADAVGAWRALAPLLPDDTGIMLRLFKEPSSYDAGCSGDRECLDFEHWASGYTALIAAVRIKAGTPSGGLGWRGIVIVDGLHNHFFPPSRSTALWPIDPNRQIAYNCDCYLDAGGISFTSPAEWNEYLSDVATHFPFLIGEFGIAPGTRAGRAVGCVRNVPMVAQNFFAWLLGNFDHKIGLIGWAYDRPSSIYVGASTTPTSFANFTRCAALGNDPTQGGGELILNQFRALAQ